MTFSTLYADPLILNTVYGPTQITDPLAQELIQSPAMQRLKHIHQYGVVRYVIPTEEYSRFDHSIGVYLWLIKAGASREEQIAGLLHDASHTVFSHVGDYVFVERVHTSSYQDDIHPWFLNQSGLGAVLQKHGLSIEAVLPKQPSFLALEQPLPALCADRLEYNLQGALRRGLIDEKQFSALVNAVRYEDGRWIFYDVELAALLGRCSLIMTETLWGSAWETILYQYAARALQRALQLGFISAYTFHFSTDDLVWNTLENCDDPIISSIFTSMYQIHEQFTLVPFGEHQEIIKNKFRGIDPWVYTSEGVKKLTEIDPSYAAQFTQVREQMRSGWPIIWTDSHTTAPYKNCMQLPIHRPHSPKE